MTRATKADEAHSWHGSDAHTRADPPYGGSMEPTRRTWNDQRMDEFAERTEENFREVRRELRDETTGIRTELKAEIQGVRTELKSEIQGLRVEMNGRFAGIEQRFNILFGALATGFAGAVVANFLG